MQEVALKLIESLEKGFQYLSEKFGVAIDGVYSILIKQAKVDLAKHSVALLLSLIVIFLLAKYIKKIYRDINVKDTFYYQMNLEDDFLIGVITITSGMVIIGAGIVALCQISPIIQIAINPDWYIFNEYIKPLIK